MNGERIERSLRMGPPDEPIYRPGRMGVGEVSTLRTRIGLMPRARESSRMTAIGLLILIALIIAGIIAVGRLREDQQQPAPTTVPAVIDVPVNGGDQGRTGRMPGPAPRSRPVEAWHVAIPNPSPSFAVTDGIAIVGDLDGLLRAIDLETRQERWRRQLGGQVLGGMVVVNGTIYVASGDGFMNAVSLGAGEPRWTEAPVASPDATPVVLDGIVYFGRPGAFVAVDADSASELWSLPIDGSGSTTATDGRLLFVGGQGSGDVTAIDPVARAYAWDLPFPTGHIQVGMPAVRDGVVYIAGQTPQEDRGRLFALSTDGDELWRYPRDADGPMMSTPAIGDDLIFVGSPYPSAAGSVMALEPATGEVTWSRELGGPNAQPSVVGDLVFATRYSETHVLDAGDGSQQYAIPTIGNANGAVVTGGLFVTMLTADRADGESGLWIYAAPDDPRLLAPGPTPSSGASRALTPSGSPSPSSLPAIGTVRGVYQFDERPSLFLGLARAPDGSLYALDHENARILPFAPDGTPGVAFGSAGAGEGEFDFSEVTPGDQSGSIAFAADGWMAIGDGGNHRVQLFDGDRTFVRALTGTADHPLINPCCVAFDAPGRVFVVDPGRGDVTVFDREGIVVDRFGERGTGPGQLLRAGTPFVASDGTVYVANYGNRRVEVFDAGGAYLRRYGNDPARGINMDEVNWVVVDRGGRVFIGDTRDRLVAFDQAGRALGTFGPDVPGIGRVQIGPMALSPDGHLFVAIAAGDGALPSRILDLELLPPFGTDTPN